MNTLPAGWSIEIKDQGPHINEVWLVVNQKGSNMATIVTPRNTNRGQALLELKNAE